MRLLRSRPAFARLWFAGLSSSASGWILGFALAVRVFELTGSAASSAAHLVTALAPQVLFGGLTGALVDRYPPVVVMRVATALRLVILSALGLGGGSFLALLALAASHAVVTQASASAEQAAVSQTVAPDEFPMAAGLNSVAVNVARLVSPAAAGALMTALGFGWTTAVVVALTVVGGTALLFVPRHRGTDGRPVEDLRRVALRVVARDPVTRTVAIVQVLDAVKEGALGAMFPILMLRVIGSGEAMMGAVNSSFAITALVAGPLTAATVRRLGPRFVIATGTAASGALLMVLALAPGLVTAFVGFSASGFPFTLSWAAMSALLLVHAQRSALGRILGTLSALNAGATAASALVAGLLADSIGVQPVLVVAAGVQIAAGAVAGRLLPGR